MKRTTRIALALLIVSAALVGMSGCRWVRFPTFTETRTVSLDGATKLEAELDQSVGELTLRAATDATKGVSADFAYSPESWKPEVTSSVEASTARMRIAQSISSGFSLFSYTRSTSVITLPTGVETDLRLKMGAGNAELDLRGIDLADLGIDLGAGNVTVDVTGPHSRAAAVAVRMGAGNVTLRLPKDTGVIVRFLEKGVGNVSAGGMDRQGDDTWVNEAYAGSGPKIEVEITRGAGSVTLRLAD